MQIQLNFNRELIIKGHLEADLRLAERKINQLTNKVKEQNLSLRAYRGWATKRVKNNVNKINLQSK